MKIIFLAFFSLLMLNCARPNFKDMALLDPNKKLENCSLQFSNLKTCLQVQWETPPTTKAYSSLILNFIDAQGEGVDLETLHEAQLKVILWMPSMGHGSSPTKIEKLASGSYRISRIYFIMPGDWEIRFQLSKDTQLLDQEKIELILK